jgi:hypothetical protein
MIGVNFNRNNEAHKMINSKNYSTKLTSIIFLITLGCASIASAQSIKEILDSLLTRALGEKAKQLDQVADGFLRTKSIFTGRTWDVKDASQRRARVSALATEVCYERIGMPDKVCSDYNGRETKRIGFVMMPNGTGETAKVYVDSGRIVVESEKIECTTGLRTVWATSIGLVTKNQAPVTSDVISTGGLGGCS